MTDMSKASLQLFIATTLMLTWGCGSSDQGDLAPGTEVTIEMPGGSLVTGRVAQPAVDGQPAGDGESVATVEKVAAGTVSRESATVAPKPAPPPAVAPKPAPPKPAPPRTEPQYAEVTVPAGTTLSLMLDSTLASDAIRVTDFPFND